MRRMIIYALIVNFTFYSCKKEVNVDLTKFKEIVEKYEHKNFLKKLDNYRVFEKTGFLIESISSIDTIKVKDSLNYIIKEVKFRFGENLDIDKEIKLSSWKYENTKMYFDSLQKIWKNPDLRKIDKKLYDSIQKKLSSMEWNLFKIKSIDDKLILYKKLLDKYSTMDTLKPLCVKFNAKYIINENYSLIKSDKDEFEYYNVYTNDFLVNAKTDSVINVTEYGKGLKKVVNKK